jgi:hypothetical protein
MKKESIFFDDDYYFGTAGENLAKEVLQDIGLQEPTDSEIFNETMLLMYESRNDILDDLKNWFTIGRKNPNAGNHILVSGCASRWDGRSSGIMIYSDFAEAVDTSPSRFGMKNIFADCEFNKIWEEDGKLYLSGHHHDGGVKVEMRQLSKQGEKLLEKLLDYEGDVDLYDLELEAMGNTYQEGDENKFVHDLWNDHKMCPMAEITKLAFA